MNEDLSISLADRSLHASSFMTNGATTERDNTYLDYSSMVLGDNQMASLHNPNRESISI
jgi:hypothetical protein